MKKNIYLMIMMLYTSNLTCLIITPPTFSGPWLSGIRASSAPYISGDTFRAACDFIIDETAIPFDTNALKNGDTIFLKTDLLSLFFTKIHPFITKQYVLVTGNSDDVAPGKFIDYLDDPKLIAWFGQNGTVQDHPKFTSIPIGIANQYWSHGNVQVFNELRQNIGDQTRSWLAYLNCVYTHPERAEVQKMFSNQSWCIKTELKKHQEYLADLAHSQFVLCPRGNGPDCHRTWEVLLMGAIPVIRHSTLDPLFEKLPVVLINNWNEVTEAFLQEKHREMKKQTFKLDRMFADYWLQKIIAAKNSNAGI